MRSVVITKPTSPNFAILDIGTTKVVCLIAKVSGNKSISILGVGYKEASGTRGGAIMSVKTASSSIISAIEDAEKESGQSIDEVYVCVSGCNITSKIIEASCSGSSRNISVKDIHKIISSSSDKMNDQEIILHNIPIDYVLDEIIGINNPFGMYGICLKSNINHITASKAAILNLQHCITQCPLHMKGVAFSAYTSGLSCLTKSEMDVGTALLDIGGGSTAISFFKDGKIVYAATIPIGGSHVTKDLACAFSISIDLAERIKTIHGSSIFTSSDVNEYIDIQDEDIDSRISKSSLIEIIRPRMEEIIELACEKLNDKGYTKLVLTGGASQIHNIKELTSYKIDCQVRIGAPVKLEGMKNEPDLTMSASIGSVLLVADAFTNPIASPPQKKYLHKIFDWMRMS